MGRTFQRLEVFTGMTVFENLQVAAEARRPGRTFAGAFRLRHRDDPAVVAEVDAVIELVGLGHLADRVAGSLSDRRAAPGRAGPGPVHQADRAAARRAGQRPRLERDRRPSRRCSGEVAATGVGVLLIEHDVELVMALSSYIYVLDFGSADRRGHAARRSADAARCGPPTSGSRST